MAGDNPALSVTRADFVPLESVKIGTFQELPGLYIFLNAAGHAVYIGESGHVPRRIQQHRKKPWFSEELKVVFWPCEDPEDRLMAETVMIFRERPRANRAIKIGLAKDGRLIPLQFISSKRG